MQLRIPGPTPVPPEVLQAGASPMVNHRGPEFADLITRITGRMKELMMTEHDVFVLTGSGTGVGVGEEVGVGVTGVSFIL